MPRRSAAARALTGVQTKTRRLSPPATLSEPEAKLFRETVASADPDHFVPNDLPLLTRYVEAVLLAEEAARHLRDEGLVVDGKASAWLAPHEKMIRAVVALSMRLRLSPQSRIDPKTAGRKPGAQPSYYELGE